MIKKIHAHYILAELDRSRNGIKGYPDGCKEIDPHLNNINIPVHILWGDQDAFLKADNAEQLHTRLHNSNLTIFKDCGHFFYQDKCSEFITLLKSWVNGGYKQN